MPACTPPPPPLAAIVREATVLVNSRIAAIPTPSVCLAGDVPAGSGMATPGTVWFAASDATVFSRPASDWPADRHVAVLHEVLHQVSMARGLDGAGDMALEEGSVEAVAQDLRPVWLRRLIGHDASVAIAYRGWVSTVRLRSAAATGSPWKSVAAKRWRANLLATAPADRLL